MKIFALYTNILLTKKPDWLEEFVAKYQPRGLHVTLIQPRYIDEADIPNLKQRVSRFFSTLAIGPVEIFFDELVYNRDESGAIMVCARDAVRLMQVQKNLCHTLSAYTRYVYPEREEHEKNFRPHITIGDEIPAEQYMESIAYLNDGCYCDGKICEVVLVVVNDTNSEESRNPANRTIFRL